MTTESAAMERRMRADHCDNAHSRSVVLGAVAGLRSQMPLSLLTYAANHGQILADTPPWSLLATPAARRITAVAAVGELIADKLPFTPSRLDPGPLAGRLVLGAVAGAAVAHGSGGRWTEGAMLGAIGAGLGAFVGYHVRRSLGLKTQLPDPLFGAVEDGLAVVLARAAVAAR